jgi:P-type Ca2+ transporter type 2C
LIAYLPFFQYLLGTVSMGAEDWLLVVGLAATIIPVLELSKWLARHGWFGELS